MIEIIDDDNRTITNAEYMINLLMDILEDNGKSFKRVNIDDGGASEESMVYYDVNCPYFAYDAEAVCKDNGPTEKATREQCWECKHKWLLSEVSA